jgi:hypothetical protein
MQDLQAVLS